MEWGGGCAPRQLSPAEDWCVAADTARVLTAGTESGSCAGKGRASLRGVAAWGTGASTDLRTTGALRASCSLPDRGARARCRPRPSPSDSPWEEPGGCTRQRLDTSPPPPGTAWVPTTLETQ